VLRYRTQSAPRPCAIAVIPAYLPPRTGSHICCETMSFASAAPGHTLRHHGYLTSTSRVLRIEMTHGDHPQVRARRDFALTHW